LYVDPFQGEGLFPLNPESLSALAPGEDSDNYQTERELPFEYDPRVDYFKKFDAIVPRWEVWRYETEKGDGLAGAAIFDSRTDEMSVRRKGPPTVKMGRRRTMTVSIRMYVRAIDPAGNVCPLHISTVPPSPQFPDGNDGLGTHQRVVAQKSRSGWIVVEPVEAFWSPYSGKRGNEYAAWAWAVMLHRQAKHAAHEITERPKHETDMKKQIQAQIDAMRTMGTEIGQAVAKSVADAMTPRGKRDKGAE
jgi:hypothetical protein